MTHNLKPNLAYLIDPFTRTLSQLIYSGNYKHIGRIIGADLFDVVRMSNGDAIYIDDEGLFKPADEQEYFILFDEPAASRPDNAIPRHFLAGAGLILGTNKEGGSTKPAADIDWYTQRLGFIVDKEWAETVAAMLLGEYGVYELNADFTIGKEVR